MKIVIVEDEKKINEIVKKNTEQILEKKCLDIKICQFYDYTNDLKNIIFSKEINIYILDLQLPSKNGMDIVRMIRSEANDWDSIIIISSIYNQKENFASKSWMILTYISKLDNFETNIKKNIGLALDILISKNAIEVNHEIIMKDNVLYIKKEKESKYCTIKTFDDEFRVRKSLSQLENELNIKRTNKYLFLNNKNIISIMNDKVIFKNNYEFKFK